MSTINSKPYHNLRPNLSSTIPQEGMLAVKIVEGDVGHEDAFLVTVANSESTIRTFGQIGDEDVDYSHRSWSKDGVDYSHERGDKGSFDVDIRSESREVDGVRTTRVYGTEDGATTDRITTTSGDKFQIKGLIDGFDADYQGGNDANGNYRTFGDFGEFEGDYSIRFEGSETIHAGDFGERIGKKSVRWIGAGTETIEEYEDGSGTHVTDTFSAPPPDSGINSGGVARTSGVHNGQAVDFTTETSFLTREGRDQPGLRREVKVSGDFGGVEGDYKVTEYFVPELGDLGSSLASGEILFSDQRLITDFLKQG